MGKKKLYLYKDVWSREFGNNHALNKMVLVDAGWVVPSCNPRYSGSEAALKFKVSLDNLVGPCIKCINKKRTGIKSVVEPLFIMCKTLGPSLATQNESKPNENTTGR